LSRTPPLLGDQLVDLALRVVEVAEVARLGRADPHAGRRELLGLRIVLVEIGDARGAWLILW
jgi:hypothetical protein